MDELNFTFGLGFLDGLDQCLTGIQREIRFCAPVAEKQARVHPDWQNSPFDTITGKMAPHILLPDKGCPQTITYGAGDMLLLIIDDGAESDVDDVEGMDDDDIEDGAWVPPVVEQLEPLPADVDTENDGEDQYPYPAAQGMPVLFEEIILWENQDGDVDAASHQTTTSREHLLEERAASMDYDALTEMVIELGLATNEDWNAFYRSEVMHTVMFYAQFNPTLLSLPTATKDEFEETANDAELGPESEPETKFYSYG